MRIVFLATVMVVGLSRVAFAQLDRKCSLDSVHVRPLRYINPDIDENTANTISDMLRQVVDATSNQLSRIAGFVPATQVSPHVAEVTIGVTDELRSPSVKVQMEFRCGSAKWNEYTLVDRALHGPIDTLQSNRAATSLVRKLCEQRVFTCSSQNANWPNLTVGSRGIVFVGSTLEQNGVFSLEPEFWIQASLPNRYLDSRIRFFYVETGVGSVTLRESWSSAIQEQHRIVWVEAGVRVDGFPDLVLAPVIDRFGLSVGFRMLPVFSRVDFLQGERFESQIQPAVAFLIAKRFRAAPFSLDVGVQPSISRFAINGVSPRHGLAVSIDPFIHISVN